MEYQTKVCRCGKEEIIVTTEDGYVIAQCPNNCYARILKGPPRLLAALG